VGAGDGDRIGIPPRIQQTLALLPPDPHLLGKVISVITANTGSLDAGTPIAGTLDAGTPIAGTLDAGTLDAGTPIAGTLDAGSLAGNLEAGTPIAGGDG
jgi:hypothetical protein